MPFKSLNISWRQAVGRNFFLRLRRMVESCLLGHFRNCELLLTFNAQGWGATQIKDLALHTNDLPFEVLLRIVREIHKVLFLDVNRKNLVGVLPIKVEPNISTAGGA